MDRSIAAIGRCSKAEVSQPRSTTGNDTQRGQRDVGGVQQVKEPVFIDPQIIKMCKDELDAVNLCIDLSRMSDEALCARLSIDKGHFSRMRKGRAHFPTAKRIELMWLAGNWAPLQYELYRTPVLARLKEQWETDRAHVDVHVVNDRWYA